MITKTLLLVCMSLALFGFARSVTIECKHELVPFGILGTVHQCFVSNNVRILSPDNVEVSVNSNWPANDNIEAFSIFDHGEIKYFPRGIENVFKNLKGIQIARNQLQEVHQSDLKPFSKLQNLYLQENQLQILEMDLFKFNPNLNYINLNQNKISYIHPNVFDVVPNLKYLYLQHNTKVNLLAENNKAAVQNVIKFGKNQCTNSFYSNLEQEVKNLEIQSGKLSLEEFEEKLGKLKNQVKSSTFSSFFQQRIQDLKATKDVIGVQETTTADPTLSNNFEPTSTTSFESSTTTTTTSTKKQSNDAKIKLQRSSGVNEVLMDSLSSSVAASNQKIANLEDKIVEQNQKLQKLNDKVSEITKILQDLNNVV